MEFDVEFLDEIYPDKISEKYLRHENWGVYFSFIFEFEGKYYECENYLNFIDLKEEIEESFNDKKLKDGNFVVDCPEVHQVEKMVKVWEKK